MSNYPHGVTGSEYAIAGPDSEEEIEGKCPNGHSSVVQLTYRGASWLACGSCDWSTDSVPIEQYDEDIEYDRKREEQ